MSPDPMPIMQPITLPSTTINLLPNLPTTGMPVGRPNDAAYENSDYLRIQETNGSICSAKWRCLYASRATNAKPPIPTSAADNQSCQAQQLVMAINLQKNPNQI